MSSRPKNYIALIRGVTPTGKNKVPMAKLREVLAKTELGEVSTYIQSGNVLARTPLPASEVERIVHDAIQKNFGGDLVIIAKTPAQLRRVLNQNPFDGEETSRMYFTLLQDKPTKDKLQAFSEIDFFPDRVEVIGSTIYTLYATKHSDSKFNNGFFERKLKVSATTRNSNTMTALIEKSIGKGR